MNPKPLIAPFQQILLKKAKCVACLSPLAEQKTEIISQTTKKITCKCGRIYIYETSSDSYRRAQIDEI